MDQGKIDQIEVNQNNTDFWENHSLRFLEMVFRTDKREVLEKPDGYGKRSRECGDTMEIFLIVGDGKIRSASFDTNGCLYSIACANAIAHMAEGKTISEAWELTPEDVMEYLETLPAGEAHCARLAVRTLHLALADAQETQRHPWKKLY